MAIRLLERVPLERIEEQANPVNVGRLLMLAVVGVFYLLGWTAAKAFTGLGVAAGVIGIGLGWVIAATKTGWQDARRPADGRARVGSP